MDLQENIYIKVKTTCSGRHVAGFWDLSIDVFLEVQQKYNQILCLIDYRLYCLWAPFMVWNSQHPGLATSLHYIAFGSVWQRAECSYGVWESFAWGGSWRSASLQPYPLPLSMSPLSPSPQTKPTTHDTKCKKAAGRCQIGGQTMSMRGRESFAAGNDAQSENFQIY